MVRRHNRPAAAGGHGGRVEFRDLVPQRREPLELGAEGKYFVPNPGPDGHRDHEDADKKDRNPRHNNHASNVAMSVRGRGDDGAVRAEL